MGKIPKPPATYAGAGVDIEKGDRFVDMIKSFKSTAVPLNLGGFSAGIDTGMSMGGQPIMANFRCEQFTFHNRFGGSGFFGFNDFCNRNSKISLSGAFGEFMLGQWCV